MKAELRLKPHSTLPGVRVVSKHGIQAKAAPEDGSGVNVMEIAVRTE